MAKKIAEAILVFSLLLACTSFELQAQTFEAGYKSYMRNQYPVAELQFKEAIKIAKTPEEQAFILKFIGICQYMRGDQKASQSTFEQALSLDQKLSINDQEVLDLTVVGFFNTIKGKIPPVAEEEEELFPSEPRVKTPKEPTFGVEDELIDSDPPPPPPPPPQKVQPTGKKSQPKARGSNKNSASKGHFSWLYLLPLGAGQFHNTNFLLGSIFAVGQGVALYQTIRIQSDIDQRARLSVQVSKDPSYSPEQADTFLVTNRDYIKNLQHNKNIATASFLALWLASGIQAAVTGSSPNPHLGSSVSSPSSVSQLRPLWFPDNQSGLFVIQWQHVIP